MIDPRPQLTELLAKGDRIGAIRLLREARGIGLAEAKSALERFEATGELPSERAASAALPDDVRALADQGRAIEAIKLLRSRTGMGLAEAKALVDRGAVPAKKSGCATALILMALACAGLAAGG